MTDRGTPGEAGRAAPRGAVRFASRDVVATLGRWPRRHVRMMRGAAVFDGAEVTLDEPLALDETPRRFEFRGVVATVRVAAPPMVIVDKPVGVVVSRVNDGGATTVFELLPSALAAQVEAIGRLDVETSGLIVLTGDGRLVQRLTHPKHAVARSYVAALERDPDPAAIEQLRAGTLALRDGHTPRPTGLAPRGADRLSWDVTLTEGKYHEVRRLFAAAGARVVELRRIAFAGFTLDDLRGSPWRRLGDAEVDALTASVALPLAPRQLEVEVVEPREGGVRRG
ncbi:MAG: rRNA pseudouridine synthase [Myxococcales bacterium]|nr:rRNA pseudouridine synthase [Myxococcales bacterium]MCB9533245.1 rRNA pseudouridine synthase [Myxococcales bacterium]